MKSSSSVPMVVWDNTHPCILVLPTQIKISCLNGLAVYFTIAFNILV
jgi:hypothetical protein